MSDNTQAISLMDSQQISLSRPPAQVIEFARQAAVELKKVIDLKKKPVIFNGETYLEFEDWSTCARFFNYTPKVEATEPVDFGDAQGFKATAVVLDIDGRVVSRAEALCLNDEENWGLVTEYEWKDVLKDGKKQWDPKLFKGKGGYIREKVAIGQKAKPRFQLMSMAQTRACARALRQVLSWVVVLAGYKPNVAEELSHNDFPNEDPDNPQPTNGGEIKTPARKSESNGKTMEGQAEPTGDGISEKQQNMLRAISHQLKMSDDELKAEVKKLVGVDHLRDIPKRYFQFVLEKVDHECKHHTKSDKPYDQPPQGAEGVFEKE